MFTGGKAGRQMVGRDGGCPLGADEATVAPHNGAAAQFHTVVAMMAAADDRADAVP